MVGRRISRIHTDSVSCPDKAKAVVRGMFDRAMGAEVFNRRDLKERPEFFPQNTQNTRKGDEPQRTSAGMN